MEGLRSKLRNGVNELEFEGHFRDLENVGV